MLVIGEVSWLFSAIATPADYKFNGIFWNENTRSLPIYLGNSDLPDLNDDKSTFAWRWLGTKKGDNLVSKSMIIHFPDPYPTTTIYIGTCPRGCNQNNFNDKTTQYK